MYYRTIKSISDFILGVIGTFLFFIIGILLFVYYVFNKEDEGPILYKQSRVGMHGKKFYIYKFRTMVVDADKKLLDDKELYRKYVANNFKLEPKDDPRMTKLGSFLRKTSIDEIPQFINVLKGEMSIIGPRPVVPDELVEYDKEKLLSVKPGIMGFWQSQGRSNIGYPERANLEMNYIDNASITLDMKIFIRNIIIVFKKDGAY